MRAGFRFFWFAPFEPFRTESPGPEAGALLYQVSLVEKQMAAQGRVAEGYDRYRKPVRIAAYIHDGIVIAASSAAIDRQRLHAVSAHVAQGHRPDHFSRLLKVASDKCNYPIRPTSALQPIFRSTYQP